MLRGGRRLLCSARSKGWEAGHRAAPQGNAGMPAELTKRQKRIIYRSGQRGWLELDVLLGRWAAEHVPRMVDEGELKAIEDILAAETPHMLQIVLGHVEAPEGLDTEVMRSIREYARGGVKEEGKR